MRWAWVFFLVGACSFELRPAGVQPGPSDAVTDGTRDATAGDAAADATMPGTEAGSEPSIPVLTVIDTLSVPATGQTVTSSVVLLIGITYRLRATGTLVSGGPGNGIGDAEWGVTSPPGYDFNAAFDIGLGLAGDAYGTKSTRWGAFRADAIYEINYAGAGVQLTARYHDGAYGNNSGQLTLQILQYL